MQEAALHISYTRCRADVCDFNESLDFIDRYPNLGNSTFFFSFFFLLSVDVNKLKLSLTICLFPKYWSMLQIQQQFFRALLGIHRAHKYGVEANVS